MIGFPAMTLTIPPNDNVTIVFLEVEDSSLVGETPTLENLSLQAEDNSDLFAMVILLEQGMCIRHQIFSSGVFTIILSTHLSMSQSSK